MTTKDKERLSTLAWNVQQMLADPRRQSYNLFRGDMRAIIAAAKELGVMPIWRSTEARRVSEGRDEPA